MRTSVFASERTESRSAERERRQPLTLGGVLTVTLLAIILFAMPLMLGGARLWYELPILELAAVLLLVQAVRMGRRGGEPLRLDVVDLAAVTFVVYAVIRWLTSPAEYYSRLEIVNIVGYATVFFTCRYGLARRSQALALLILLVALGAFELGFGLYLSQHLDWTPFGPHEMMQQYYAPRWVGTYGNPNHYGEILIMGLSAAFAWGAFSRLSWPLRILFFWIGVIILTGVIYSGSRGSLLAALMAILALTIAGTRDGAVRWWVPTILTLLLLVGAGLVVSQSKLEQDRFSEAEGYFAHGNVPAYVRVVLDRDALRIAHDYPFFGTGPATFVFIHPRYQDDKFTHRAVLTHDDYLNCLADYGGVGLAIALVFVVGVTRRLLRRPRATGRWQDRVILTAAFMAWSALLLHSAVDFNMHIPANALMIFALAGMGLRRAPSEANVRTWGVSLPRRPVALLVGLLALGYGFEVGRTGWSDIIFEHTRDASLDVRPSESIEGAKEALAIDPGNVPALVFLGDMYRMEASRRTDLAQRLSDGAQAIAAYQKAGRLNPLEDMTTASLGVTFDLLYRYPEAYFCYAEALAHQPYDGQFWFRLGNHYWETGLLDKAEQAYQMGLHCPNGWEENVGPAQAIRSYLAGQGIPLPPPGTDPLKPESNIVHPTVP